MDISFSSAVILLLLVMDPFGNIPIFLAVLKNVPPKKRVRVILRECFVASIVLLAFFIFGKTFLSLLRLSETSLGIAGGVILFLIALRMIFHHPEGIFGDLPEGDPFIVPLAIPALVGPSTMATALLLVSSRPDRIPEWILAAVFAMLISTIVLALSANIHRIIGQRGVIALERLMGLILTAIAVEMFLAGIQKFIEHLSYS
ncbi:MAG: MarC family protein [Verrucomicrobiota bacterium]